MRPSMNSHNAPAFAKNPPADKLASNLNRIAFVGTIGFQRIVRYSQLVANTAYVPTVVRGELTGK